MSVLEESNYASLTHQLSRHQKRPKYIIPFCFLSGKYIFESGLYANQIRVMLQSRQYCCISRFLNLRVRFLGHLYVLGGGGRRRPFTPSDILLKIAPAPSYRARIEAPSSIPAMPPMSAIWGKSFVQNDALKRIAFYDAKPLVIFRLSHAPGCHRRRAGTRAGCSTCSWGQRT